MKYLVTTRATVRRTYTVEAENEKAAISATTFVTPDDEDDLEEETLGVERVEVEKPALTEAQRLQMQGLSDDPHEVYAKCVYCGVGNVKRGFVRTCCEKGAEVDRELRLPDEISNAPWTRDDLATFVCLQLIGEADGVTETDVATWTDKECQQAEDWAGAIHLKASDNDDVVVPPMPECVRRCVQRASTNGSEQ